MGSRDYRRRETKKVKKGTKKADVTTVLAPSAPVEVIKKTREPKPTAPAESEE